MNVNPLRRLWKNGRAAVGTYIMYSRDITTVQVAAAAGLDFVLFDLEHRPQTSETIHDLCQVARLAGLAPLVGPQFIASDAISHALDLGASGVVIPHVQTSEEVQLAVDAVRYPPAGRRGRCGMAGHNLYRPAPAEDEMAHYNEEIALLLKVESEAAIARLDDLILPGVDGVMIGPSDLALDMGVGAKTDDPRVASLVERVRSVCHARGVVYGTYIGRPEDVPEALAQGARLIIVGSELGTLAASWTRAGQQAREQEN